MVAIQLHGQLSLASELSQQLHSQLFRLQWIKPFILTLCIPNFTNQLECSLLSCLASQLYRIAMITLHDMICRQLHEYLSIVVMQLSITQVPSQLFITLSSINCKRFNKLHVHAQLHSQQLHSYLHNQLPCSESYYKCNVCK